MGRGERRLFCWQSRPSAQLPAELRRGYTALSLAVLLVTHTGAGAGAGTRTVAGTGTGAATGAGAVLRSDSIA